MSGRVLIVKNIEREGPGLLREVLQHNDVEADCVEVGRDEIPPLERYSALIVLGGPTSANDETDSMHAELATVQEALRSGLPYLGVCLGHQVLGHAAGATIEPNPVKEIGFKDEAGVPNTVSLTDAGKFDPLFDGVPQTFRVFQLHGEAVLPHPEIEVLASSEHCDVQAIRVGRRAYGLQMHIEVTPEMLAVWAAEDPDLALHNVEDLLEELMVISDEYNIVGRRILTNFIAMAGLASSIELDLGVADLR